MELDPVNNGVAEPPETADAEGKGDAEPRMHMEEGHMENFELKITFGFLMLNLFLELLWFIPLLPYMQK